MFLLHDKLEWSSASEAGVSEAELHSVFAFTSRRSRSPLRLERLLILPGSRVDDGHVASPAVTGAYDYDVLLRTRFQDLLSC